ncbi:MAG: phosphatase PAP2 family protein [Fimbriimonadaceae bacterium]|nr:phosphatase PAP2 family protein [Fimbriimonadaceae bacterium]
MSLDEALFRLVNETSANPLFDAWMPWLTAGDRVLAVLLGSGLLVLAQAALRRDRAALRLAGRVVLVALGGVALCELIGGNLLKPLLARPRPPLALAEVRLLVGLGPSGSFPSLHAANSLAVTSALVYGYRRLAPLLVYPVVIAYSRVYVGVHYPSDVLAGALLGGLATALLWRLSGRPRGMLATEAQAA